jgi:hypothetical protein
MDDGLAGTTALPAPMGRPERYPSRQNRTAAGGLAHDEGTR